MTTAEYLSRYSIGYADDDYEFACHVADCPEVSHESEDFRKCESCACLLCDEHTQRMLNDPTPYCQECAKCTSKRADCDGTSAFLCDGCGAPTCWNCVYRHDTPQYVPFGGSITLNDDGSWPIVRSYLCRACYVEIPDEEYCVRQSVDDCPIHRDAIPPTSFFAVQEETCPF